MMVDRGSHHAHRTLITGTFADQAVSASALLPNSDRIARVDQFADNPPAQPKRAMAEYVASEGAAPVPRMYGSLNEAMARLYNGVDMRNESPDQYAGPSGLAPSLHITPNNFAQARQYVEEYGGDINFGVFDPETGIVNDGDTKRVVTRILGQALRVPQTEFEYLLKQYSISKLGLYTHYLGLDLPTYLNNMSFSYWEHVPGINMSVVADSSVQGRHYVTSRVHGGIIMFGIEDNRIISSSLDRARNWTELTTRALAAIPTYERIRHLPKFDPNRCPVIELQSPPDQPDAPVFLQYYQGREYMPADFVLGPKRKGWVGATFTRGATVKEGMNIKVVQRHGVLELEGPVPRDRLVREADGEMQRKYGDAYIQAVVAKRRLIVLPGEVQFALHASNSLLFKPEITIGLSDEGCFKIAATEQELRTSHLGGRPFTFEAEVVSDGKRSYIRRV